MSGAPTLELAAAEVRAGRARAADFVERALERARHNAHLGAVVGLREHAAHEEAATIDAAVHAGADPGPLAGLPVLAKDNDDVAGMRTTHGSLWFRDAPAANRDGVVVGRLRAAGAVVIGKSNVPEFSIEGYTANRVFGPTRNPWNPTLSPGGSSGGSAAALAAGIAPIATGTDGGGSVRIPAALCGLLGFKPTNGVIGRRRAPDWIDFSTDGLMAAQVADLRTLLRVVAGPVPGDPAAVPGPLPPARGMRRLIAAERTDTLGPLPAEVAVAFAAASARLAAALDLPVERREPGWFFPGTHPDIDWFTIATAEHARMFGRAAIQERLGLLHPASREFLSAGLAVTIEDYLAARRRRFEHAARLEEILGADGVLVTPSVAVGGFPAEGTDALMPAEVYSTAIQNMTGLPAISVPAGLLPNGMPFGLQLTGPRFSDLTLLELAERWERSAPWPLSAPGFETFTRPDSASQTQQGDHHVEGRT